MMFGLSQETINKVNSVFEIHSEVEEVILYGSRAKGNFKEGSDIDITLKGDKITDILVNELKVAIDDLNTPYLFDISIYQNISNKALIDHIQRVGKPFFVRNTIENIVKH
ncbi:MAG: nucleotidyltransferase domain-containing protein [bacterium]|nr:nucleotidyltransferase domain-containing protein [bacterium]